MLIQAANRGELARTYEAANRSDGPAVKGDLATGRCTLNVVGGPDPQVLPWVLEGRGMYRSDCARRAG